MADGLNLLEGCVPIAMGVRELLGGRVFAPKLFRMMAMDSVASDDRNLA